VPELEQTIRILTESTCFARPGPAGGERVPGADPGDDWEDIDRGDDAMTLPTFVMIGAMRRGPSQAYRQAGQACAHFKRGAACYAAAARAFSYNPAANKPGAKFPRLLGCGDAAVNKGATLIAVAAADASFLQTPD
jgi:hypothetical protein